LQHNFLMGGSEDAKQRNADEFVRKVKELLEKQ
jgi:heptaprenylglyceryl phosphate synthase